MIPPYKLLRSAEDDVITLSKIYKRYWDEPRYKILSEFTKSGGKILSVGCGPKEPIITHATHALDLTLLSEKYLRANGFTGEFFVGSCTSLPFKKHEFDIVVCSEVIEHLPTIDDVVKTFKEVSRVGKKWIISTPNSDVDKPAKQNPHHLLFFTQESIKKIIPVDYQIYANDHHLYIENF